MRTCKIRRRKKLVVKQKGCCEARMLAVFLIKRLEAIEKRWIALLHKELNKMAKTLEETTAAFNELKETMAEQIKEVADLIAAVNVVLERVPVPADLQPLFDSIVESRDALLSDNPLVQAALDKVTPSTPPVA